MRPPEDDEPQFWWIASTAIPLVAAAAGPLANVMSIVALVMPWRSKIIDRIEGPAGNWIQEGYDDPHWYGPSGSGNTVDIADRVDRIIAMNAVSLVCGVVGNVFLLFNFTTFVRYIIALPVTIVSWFLATGIVSEMSMLFLT
jgi:potassium channel subfamily K